MIVDRAVQPRTTCDRTGARGMCSGNEIRTVKPSSAFTLIELLLAITIFSIVLVAMHMVFYTALQLRNKTEDAFNESVPLQRTLALMKKDIANLVAPGGILSGTLQSTQLGVGQTTQSSSSSSSSLQATEGSALTMLPIPGAVDSSPFFFTSTGTISDTLPWADIQQVSYVLMQSGGQTAGKTLMRCVTRNLLPVSNPDPPEQERLLEGVQSMAFLFFDGLEWLDVWDSTQVTTNTVMTNSLPLAIKVQIQLVPEPGQRVAPLPIELVVPIDVQPRTTNETNQAASSDTTQ
jgi:prepilin-type N-terminal cleavage/methylation domain-containing protein